MLFRFRLLLSLCSLQLAAATDPADETMLVQSVLHAADISLGASVQQKEALAQLLGLQKKLDDLSRAGVLRTNMSDDSAMAPILMSELKHQVNSSFLEVVVASMCEDLKWFKAFPTPITVYAKDTKCGPGLRVALSQTPNGRTENLPNIGREGHTYVTHILKNWDNLATYTAFTQGDGKHNGVNITDKVLAFLAKGEQWKEPVVPLVHANQRGMILYRDADYNDSTHLLNGGDDRATNTYMFPYYPNLDMANRARAMYLSLFGGNACEIPPMVFAAGAQFAVHRDAIHSRPKEFWQFLSDSLAKYPSYGYDFERVWLHVFNPKLKPLTKLEVPNFIKYGSPAKTWHCAKYQEQVGVSEMQQSFPGVDYKWGK